MTIVIVFVLAYAIVMGWAILGRRRENNMTVVLPAESIRKLDLICKETGMTRHELIECMVDLDWSTRQNGDEGAVGVATPEMAARVKARLTKGLTRKTKGAKG